MKKLLLSLMLALGFATAARATNTNVVFYLTNDTPVTVQALIYSTNQVIGTPHFNSLYNVTQPFYVLPGTLTNIGTAVFTNIPPFFYGVTASNSVFGSGSVLLSTNFQYDGTNTTTVTYTNSVSFIMSLTNGFNFTSLPPPPLY